LSGRFSCRTFYLPDAFRLGLSFCPEVIMHISITRPVVISSAAGLRHLAPGLVVELTDAEADQVLRQNAGSTCSEPTAKMSKTKTKGETDK
jgi:hypothetical protein